jgi:DNA-binding NarL/FixJ family response regulator
VNPANNTLDEFGSYIFKAAEEFFQKSTVRCHMDVPALLPAVPLSADLRHHLFLAFAEALNYLLKHADDADIRDGLARLIDGTPGFRCLGAYATAEEAIKHIPQLRPQVVPMDINLPKMSGIACVARLKALDPAVQILMLTINETSDKVFEALAAGASGYLVQSITPDKLMEAIHEVLNGAPPMSGHIARKVVQYFHRRGPSREISENLSPREEEILRLLVDGCLDKEIAARLGIGLETVRTHVQHIYQKLHVRNRTEAVVKYLRPSHL